MAAKPIIVAFDKPHPQAKLGLRLADAKAGIKVAEIDPNGPLASLMAVGEIITKINGIPVSTLGNGHVQAAQIMQDAPSRIEFELAPRKASLFQRIAGRHSSKLERAGSTAGSASSSASAGLPTAETTPAGTVSKPGPTSAPQRLPPPTDLPAAATAGLVEGVPITSSPPSLLPPSKPMLATESPGPTAGEVPTGSAMSIAPTAVDHNASVAPLGPAEYRVTLRRNTKKTIGMRLVQKKLAELPSIADIDPKGPVANAGVEIGDILVAVNGVDARASPEELKKALSLSDEAELTLRRKPQLPPGNVARVRTPQQGRPAYGTNRGSDYDSTYSTVKPPSESSWLFSSCCAVRQPVDGGRSLA